MKRALTDPHIFSGIGNAYSDSGERHEFGILAAAMLAAAGGLGVVYVGADVPARLIVDSAARSGVDVAVLGVIYSGTSGSFASRWTTSSITCRAGSSCRWVVSCRPISAAHSRAGRLCAFPDFEALERQLVRIGARF